MPTRKPVSRVSHQITNRPVLRRGHVFQACKKIPRLDKRQKHINLIFLGVESSSTAGIPSPINFRKEE